MSLGVTKPHKWFFSEAFGHKEDKAIGDTGWGKVWFTTWMSAFGRTKVVPKESAPKEESATVDGSEAAQSLLVQNPEINAATFLNLLKSKGFVITAPKMVDPEPKQKQADSASANAQFVRDGVKKESQKHLKSIVNFRESSYADNGIGATKFNVVLIKEGMGNLRDAFYYPKQALKLATSLFEGKKCYANHPSLSDEQNRPERDVREIIGHFENASYQESDDGQGMIVADCNLMPDKDYEWARGLFRETVEYSKKYPDKDLVGLSINANGDADEVPLEDFIKESEVPDPCMRKLAQAKEQGINRIRVVSRITDAMSCDLVTEAGAGGKIVKLIEGDKVK